MSRLEVDGVVFSLQALHPNIHHGQGYNRLPQNNCIFLNEFLILLIYKYK